MKENFPSIGFADYLAICTNVALIGKVTPTLRAVSGELVDEKDIYIRFVYEVLPSPKERELIDKFKKEFEKFLLEDYTFKTQVMQENPDKDIPYLKHLLYLRYEGD